MGIGVASRLGRQASVESLRTVLCSKVFWSVSTNLAIAATILQGGAPWGAHVLQAVFGAFSATWITYAWRLRKAR